MKNQLANVIEHRLMPGRVQLAALWIVNHLMIETGISIIDFAIGAFIGVILLGIIITYISGQDTSGWNTQTITVWGILGILLLVLLVRHLADGRD